ncbi:hypothetical protein ACUNWD_02470 [Sunxiuqinia sp. A32]|uniref:hypothetical protein n=1 Tax=Sunxiuqinia sp. A32 TaxID=3461496 RepID=UPI0040468298
MIKSITTGLVLSLVVLCGYAQNDSVQVSTVKPEYDFIYRELFNFSPNSIFGALRLDEASPGISNYKPTTPLVIDFSQFKSFSTLSLTNSLPVFSPFIDSFSLTNQAHYKLNDKLILGGNSFSANSIFNPLPLNPNIKDMSIRGASMFLQYKVSDKVKIGGSFSISNQNNPLFPY